MFHVFDSFFYIRNNVDTIDVMVERKSFKKHIFEKKKWLKKEHPTPFFVLFYIRGWRFFTLGLVEGQLLTYQRSIKSMFFNHVRSMAHGMYIFFFSFHYHF